MNLTKVCPDCLGTRRNELGSKCATCDGTGRVPVEVKESKQKDTAQG